MITRETDALIRVTGTAAIFCGLWIKCLARKSSVCKLSGKMIARGEWQYRPMTNTECRTQRVKADVLENYADPRLFAKY